MPLMIDAIGLLPLLQRLDVTRTAAHSALDLMVQAEGDAFDEYADLAEQTTQAVSNALIELEQQLRALVNEADRENPN